MAKKKIRLTSQLNLKGGKSHNPGEVVEVDETQAKNIINGRGGVEVKEDTKDDKTQEKPKG